jgi:hypothetical protein
MQFIREDGLPGTSSAVENGCSGARVCEENVTYLLII